MSVRAEQIAASKALVEQAHELTVACALYLRREGHGVCARGAVPVSYDTPDDMKDRLAQLKEPIGKGGDDD